jgi:microcystin-dependent protein
MAVLWQSPSVPFIDPNGDPYSGAKATFYESGTTTPLTVYQDGGLDNAHDNPVVANANGVFPAVFLPATTYKVIVTDADVAETIFSADEIDAPAVQGTTNSGSGDTDITLLARTGDLKFRYDTGTHSGWVRAAGRTIGDASSGATERANADTEDLFEHLWTVDSNLTVSSGRGSTAAGDFAAHKTITLPDLRSRSPLGLATMGNSDISLIDDSQVDNSADADTLGATAGEATHALVVGELAAHTHTGTTASAGAHTHSITIGSNDHGTGEEQPNKYVVGANTTLTTASAGAHTHTFTTASTGSGTGHNNIQPVMFMTAYIKL